MLRSSGLLLFSLLAVIGVDRAYGASAEPICSTPAVIFCDDFENEILPGVWQDGYNPAVHAITSDLANVYKGTKALQATYSVGSDGGFLTRWFMPGYDHAYARLYVKFEPGWQCGINCTKIFAFYGNRTNNRWSGFGKAGTRPSGTDRFYTALVTLNWYRQPDPRELIFYSYFPEMTQAPDGMYWGNFFFQNDPREAIQPGRWYCLELELQANKPGARDGARAGFTGPETVRARERPDRARREGGLYRSGDPTNLNSEGPHGNEYQEHLGRS